MINFRKKVRDNDDLRKIEDGITERNKTPMSGRVCASCQQELGLGVHKRLVVKDSADVIFELFYHDTMHCFDLGTINQQLQSRGQTVIGQGNITDSESIKKFPEKARKMFFEGNS